ncbi:MAG: serine hydrolase [Rubripirellula sp.]
MCDRVIAEETSNRGELNPRMQQDISDLQRALIREEVTGSNIVVVSQAGKVIYESIENSGKAGDREITHKTLFPIWSMSKPVTIVAMLKLHEQGLFDWEDPVAMYIPCFKDLPSAYTFEDH